MYRAVWVLLMSFSLIIAVALTASAQMNVIEDSALTLEEILPTGDPKADKKIVKAIANIDKSLTPEWWVDDMNLDVKDGKKVFDEIRKAVKELTKKETQGIPEVQTVVDSLVSAAEALAQKAIDDATAAGGDPKDLVKANDKMAKATGELAKGNPDKAIHHYGEAWKKAQKTYQAQYKKIVAIGNKLDSVERRLEKALMEYEEKTPAPKGMEGKLMAMANQLMVQEEKLMEVLDTMPEMRMPETNGLDEALQDVGHHAVRIAGHAQAGSQMPIDPDVLGALGQLKEAAESIVLIVHVHFDVLWDKVIPLRFVQVHNCFPFIQSCEPHLDWESIDASVDKLNEALHGIGLHFWIKSVERYYMNNFAHEGFPKGSPLEWSDAVDEIGQVFPIIDVFPPTELNRLANQWIGYMSTIFSDPREILVWVFSRYSLVSREIGASEASFPEKGRFVVMSAQNIYDPDRPPDQPALSPYHFTHEIGHFFGVRHTWGGPTGINPYTQEPIAWPDLWDLIYCTGPLGFPFSFSSRQAAEDADCNFQNIEKDSINCRVDNRDGTDDSDMHCSVHMGDYYSGDPLLKGLSFPTGMIEDPPDDAYDATYSFEWGLNAMGWWGRYNAHIWTPGRFSASQLELIKGHTLHDVPIVDADGYYSPFVDLTSKRSQLGD